MSHGINHGSQSPAPAKAAPGAALAEKSARRAGREGDRRGAAIFTSLDADHAGLGPVGGWPKRAFDILFAMSALVFLAPLLVVISLLIFLQDRHQPFYRHRRIGFHGRPIRVLKFRSMAIDSEARLQRLLAENPAARAEWEEGHKLKVDPRITGIGRFLRKSSLDELPQLWNILIGEMSLVGPRPIVTDEVSRYASAFPTYCRARPGLTGLWQISGRNDVSYRERVSLDVRYVKTQSFFGDIGVIVRTLPAVLLRRGSY